MTSRMTGTSRTPQAIADHSDTPRITAAAVAAHLGVDAETIRVKARAGIIPGIRIGTAWRFNLAEVEEALAAHAAPPTDSWAQSRHSAHARRKH